MHLAGFVKRTLHLTCCVFRAFWRDRRCLSSSTHFSFFPSLCAKASPLFCSMLSTGILNTIGFKISPLATELSVGLQVPFCNCKQRFYRKIGEKKRNHLTFWCFKALHPPFTHRKETSCPSALTPGAGLSLAELPPCTCPLLFGLVTLSFPSIVPSAPQREPRSGVRGSTHHVGEAQRQMLSATVLLLHVCEAFLQFFWFYGSGDSKEP